jgi:hypothetical protein
MEKGYRLGRLLNQRSEFGRRASALRLS